MILGYGIKEGTKSYEEAVDIEEECASDPLESESYESHEAEDKVQDQEDEPGVLEAVGLLWCLPHRDVGI